MALVRFGSVVTDMRGKVSGSVFQGGNAGVVLRNHSKPINKQNALTSSRRSLMQQLQQHWGSLSVDQRSSWSAWSTFSPIQQHRNADKFLNGHQCFLQVNYYRRLYSYAILDSPIFAKSTATPYTISVTKLLSALLIEFSESIVPSDILFLISLSAPLPNGVNNGLNRVRQIIFTNDQTDALNITTAYTSLFGAVPAAGSRLFISYATMYLTTGSFTNFTNEVQTL